MDDRPEDRPADPPVVAMAAERPTVFVRAHLYRSGPAFLCGRPHHGLLLPVPVDLGELIVCPPCRAALRAETERKDADGGR